MAKYRVVGNLTHNRKNYSDGDTVEMDEKQAKAIPWAVQPLKAAEAPSSKGKSDDDSKGKSDDDGKAKGKGK